MLLVREIVAKLWWLHLTVETPAGLLVHWLLYILDLGWRLYRGSRRWCMVRFIVVRVSATTAVATAEVVCSAASVAVSVVRGLVAAGAISSR